MSTQSGKKGKQLELKGETEVKSKDATDAELTKFVTDLYDTSTISDTNLSNIYESIKYIGFDRNIILTKFMQKSLEVFVMVKIILCCALRGPISASKTIITGGKTLLQMGIPASGGKGTNDLTCSRIASATADLAAYYLKKLNIPKRISNTTLPAWLQFPAAGSIKLPDNYRTEHKLFCETFSKLINGQFNQDIYRSMVDNSYYDVKLKLFED